MASPPIYSSLWPSLTVIDRHWHHWLTKNEQLYRLIQSYVYISSTLLIHVYLRVNSSPGPCPSTSPVHRVVHFHRPQHRGAPAIIGIEMAIPKSRWKLAVNTYIYTYVNISITCVHYAFSCIHYTLKIITYTANWKICIIYIYIYMYVCIYIYMYINVYIYIYVCVCIYARAVKPPAYRAVLICSHYASI